MMTKINDRRYVMDQRVLIKNPLTNIVDKCIMGIALFVSILDFQVMVIGASVYD